MSVQYSNIRRHQPDRGGLAHAHKLGGVSGGKCGGGGGGGKCFAGATAGAGRAGIIKLHAHAERFYLAAARKPPVHCDPLPAHTHARPYTRTHTTHKRTHPHTRIIYVCEYASVCMCVRISHCIWGRRCVRELYIYVYTYTYTPPPPPLRLHLHRRRHLI